MNLNTLCSSVATVAAASTAATTTAYGYIAQAQRAHEINVILIPSIPLCPSV